MALYHQFDVLTNTKGDSLVGFQVLVRDPASGALIPIYGDENGTPIISTSGIDDVALTDGAGNYSLFVEPGTYNLEYRDPAGITTGTTRQVPMQNGGTGVAGPSNNTRETLTDLKAADTTDLTSLYDGSLWTWTPGNFTGQADDINIVKADSTALSVGAWLRQKADGIAVQQSGANAAIRTASEKLRENVSVTDFWLAADADDTNSFTRAQATGKRVFVPAGKGHGPAGVYLINFCPLVSGAYIYGEGAGTVIRPTILANGNCFIANSGSATAFLDNITILDLVLYGRVEEGGFLEPEHLIRMSGVRNVLIQDCTIKGFRGDGIYIGSGEVAGQERHNFTVRVLGCTFDGINADNRNAISVIDGISVTIEGNTFTRCTRPNMPGPIDFEPDGYAFHRLSDITVRNNRFDACGGNLGQIGFLFPPSVPLPSRVTVTGNQFTNYIGTGADIAMDMRRAVSASDYSMSVTIDGNQGSNGRRPIDIVSAIGVTVTDSNQFQDYAGPPLLGFTGPTDKARDLSFGGKYIRCGTATAAGLLVNAVTNLTVTASLDTCGQASASGYPIQFGATTSANVSLRNIRIKPAPGQTVAINNSGHTFTASTNKMLNVDAGGLTSQFQAQTEQQSTLGYLNGWSDAGDTLAYRNSEGRVFARLSLSGGTLTAGTLIATLPAGFRPVVQERALLLSGTGQAWVRIDPDGSIFLTPNAAPAASLAGTLSFNAGQ